MPAAVARPRHAVREPDAQHRGLDRNDREPRRLTADDRALVTADGTLGIIPGADPTIYLVFTPDWTLSTVCVELTTA